MRPALLTHIRVFGEHELSCYDCSLTLPKYLRVGALPDVASELAFSYRLGETPGFGYCFVDG